jgi:quercetin dioxygenase-like cupin family protein
MAEILPFPEFPKPSVMVTLWDEKGRPQEQTVRARLAADGYQALRWSSQPGQAYIPHAHIYPELLWLLSGTITVLLPAEGRLLELRPGDRIEIPAGVMHAVLVGEDGAEYLMATR